MKKNEWLNKPIILSLLFLLTIICVALVFENLFNLMKVSSGILVEPITCTVAALIFGLIYTKINKEMLLKNQKIKISLYFLIFTISFFLLFSSVFMDLFNKKMPFLIVDLIIIFSSSIFLVISVSCIYPALGLGCKITNPNKSNNTEKTKLQDFLIIIFFIVLTIFYNNVDKTAVNTLTTMVMENMGYVRVKPVHIELKSFEDKISVSGIDFIYTQNYANPKLGYYYYIPKSIKKNKVQKAPFLIMVPGLSGNGQDFVTQPYKDFAQKKGFIIIAPSFMEDDKNWNSETSYQYPIAWSGKAFNNILSDFSTKQNIHPKGLYLFGISAGAQFAERYALLYPKDVTACFLCAPGGVTLPTTKQKTKFIISVGNKDENVRKQAAYKFYKTAKTLGINVKYKEYNIGHGLSDKQIHDSIVFFRSANRN